MPTDGDGLATVSLPERPAGCLDLDPRALAGPAARRPPEGLDTELSEYVVVRTLPVDFDIADLGPTWDNVHHYVLRYWEAMAPCMDNWLRLGDEQQCRTYARLIRRLTSEDRFDHYGYMPVTRDLTRCQRTLLHAWCDSVTGEGPMPDDAAGARPVRAVVAARPADSRPADSRAAAAPVPAAPSGKDPYGRGF